MLLVNLVLAVLFLNFSKGHEKNNEAEADTAANEERAVEWDGSQQASKEPQKSAFPSKLLEEVEEEKGGVMRFSVRHLSAVT
jgi:hypothetical protein